MKCAEGCIKKSGRLTNCEEGSKTVSPAAASPPGAGSRTCGSACQPSRTCPRRGGWRRRRVRAPRPPAAAPAGISPPSRIPAPAKVSPATSCTFVTSMKLFALRNEIRKNISNSKPNLSCLSFQSFLLIRFPGRISSLFMEKMKQKECLSAQYSFPTVCGEWEKSFV